MKLKKITAGLLAAVIAAAGAVNAFAAQPDISVAKIENGIVRYSGEAITPYFNVFADCWSGLSKEGPNKLNCAGGTTVRSGYTAEAIVHLQQLQSDGSWDTIKSWSSKTANNASISKDWYVLSGTYRVSTSHRAYSGSTLVEAFTSISQTVII